jgi:hypothetical protein
VTERWTGCGLCLTGHVRSVLSVHACLGFLIGRGGVFGHDRPDASGCCGSLLDSNRTLALWRSVRLAARPVATRWSAARLDQRVRSATGLARPIELCASSLCDQHVRSARLQLNLLPNGSIQRGTSINTCWPALGSHSCTL